jgi:plastocyanin
MQSKMMIWGGTLILGLSLILAACNSPSTGNTGETPVVCSTIKTTAGNEYDPKACTAKVGQKVIIETSGTHPLKDVTVGGPIDTGEKSTDGKTVSVTFTAPGTYSFFCQNHGVGSGLMKGTITVTN